MADGYTYKAKINGEWVDINLVESPAELTAKLEKYEEWAKVVRCKDCKHFFKDDRRYVIVYRCELLHEDMRDYFFCADGERREEE